MNTKRIYCLSTCSTCRKILSNLDLHGIELINLREQNISKEDLDLMKKHVGSYESLFNKRAQKWKAIPIEKRPIKDADYKKLILKEYTFLKRPAAIVDDKVIVGSDTKSVEALNSAFGKT